MVLGFNCSKISIQIYILAKFSTLFELCLCAVTSPGREIEKPKTEIFQEIKEVVTVPFYSTEGLSESLNRANFHNHWSARRDSLSPFPSTFRPQKRTKKKTFTVSHSMSVHTQTSGKKGNSSILHYTYP